MLIPPPSDQDKSDHNLSIAQWFRTTTKFQRVCFLGGVGVGLWLYLSNDFGGYLAKFIFLIAVCLGFAVGILGQYVIDLSKALFWAKDPNASHRGVAASEDKDSLKPEQE